MDPVNRDVKFGDVVWIAGAAAAGAVKQVTVLGRVKDSPDLFLHFGRLVKPPEGMPLAGDTGTDYAFQVSPKAAICEPPAPAVPLMDAPRLAPAHAAALHEVARLTQLNTSLTDQIRQLEGRVLDRERVLRTARDVLRPGGILESRTATEAPILHQQQYMFRCDREACPGGPMWHNETSCPGLPGGRRV